ncbi:MAG TPA: FecR family protein, partial [Methylophilaceae bacterium]|nr:FecR family protein [Methylophilaceae bacterium]
MNNPSFSFSRQTLIAALISAAFPLTSQAAAGRVEFAVGSVNAVGRDGSSRALTKGGEIDNGDTIQTAEGRAQIRFSDGGYISLQPNTEFKVEDYSYSGKPDGSEKGVFSLVKGGLRAITGAIGHTNKQAYRVNTPVATIGIRGTEYLAQYGGTKLLVKVGNGAVYLVNSAGDIVLYKGQVGEVGEGTKPQYSSEQPSVAAAGPAGGTPQETQEQQDNKEQEQIFLAGELRTEDGAPCAISDTCFNGH